MKTTARCGNERIVVRISTLTTIRFVKLKLDLKALKLEPAIVKGNGSDLDDWMASVVPSARFDVEECPPGSYCVSASHGVT